MGVKTRYIGQYQWSWDKPYSLGCNHLCPMLQFGSKHVCFEDMHIFKHCHKMTLFLLWIGTYCISCVVQQTSGVTLGLNALVRYDDSSLAAIRHVRSILPVVRPRPNIRSHSVLFVLRTDSFVIKRWRLCKVSVPSYWIGWRTMWRRWVIDKWQRGRAVRALQLWSGGPEFKSCPEGYLDLFS